MLWTVTVWCLNGIELHALIWLCNVWVLHKCEQVSKWYYVLVSFYYFSFYGCLYMESLGGVLSQSRYMFLAVKCLSFCLLLIINTILVFAKYSSICLWSFVTSSLGEIFHYIHRSILEQCSGSYSFRSILRKL